MNNIFFALILILAVGGIGCQRISAREVLPDYVKKKEAAAAAREGTNEPASTNPPTFFPGRKID